MILTVNPKRADSPEEAIATLLFGHSIVITATALKELLRRHPLVSGLVSVDQHKKLVVGPIPSRDLKRVTSESGLLGRSQWSAGSTELANAFDAVLARSAFIEHPASPMGTLLEEAAAHWPSDASDEAAQVVQDLDSAIEHWTNQRLWSLNLAPELVAHDERHVFAVDGLAASLVRPFVVGRAPGYKFTPIQLQWLSVAAWLHDWGHVGGTVTPWTIGSAKDPIVNSSLEVRVLHGLVSQHLLGNSWRTMHGLDPHVASGAAILCGHHQSWSSFDESRPVRRDDDDPKPDPVALLARRGLVPVTLEEDVQRSGLDEHASFEKLQLLVAILRVADGVDVGRHRVTDIGSGRNGFLARCLHHEAMKTAVQLEAIPNPDKALISDIVSARQFAMAALQGGDLDNIMSASGVDQRRSTGPIGDLANYARFLGDQGPHFEKHQLIDGVSFVFNDGAFEAIVTPAEIDNRSASAAVDAVAGDLRNELKKNKVRQVLAYHGITFSRVRTPKSMKGDGAEVDLLTSSTSHG